MAPGRYLFRFLIILCTIASALQLYQLFSNSRGLIRKEDADQFALHPTVTNGPVFHNSQVLNTERIRQSIKRKKKSKFGPKFSFRGLEKGPGYAPTGGVLPIETNNQHYPDPRSWPAIDNGTCLGASPEPVYKWQKRAPYFIVLGTMKGGTHAVTEYLWQHPLVAERSSGWEMHFFNAKDFHRGPDGIPQRENQIAYAARFRRSHPTFFQDAGRQIPADDRTIAFDNTPYYLLASERMPESILCVAPWAKLLAVLRDPIARAESQFRFQDESRRFNEKPMVDWEVWIEDDIRLLREAGVVQDWKRVDFDSFAGSDAEMLAWKRYIRNPNSQMLVGRGLYTIQLEHYFAAMDKAGKPRSDLLIVRSEELREHTQEVYSKILDFLDLPLHVLRDSSEKHETPQGAMPLPKDLRRKLEQFYEPYNQRLYNLLGWENVWNAKSLGR